MTTVHDTTDISTIIGTQLPYLRRYARALTGSQSSGDNYAAATLEAILADPDAFDAGLGEKAALFRVFHTIWQSSGAPVGGSEPGLNASAQEHLRKLGTDTREALLLSTIEEFVPQDVAVIMGVQIAEAEALIRSAYVEMEDAIAGKVLVIEDEPIIAMDLQGLVSSLGHKVTGVARTRDRAVELGKTDPPDLILADIQLADNSSGIEAVSDLIAALGDVPVIFITAFPERLLTGEQREPAFLISKPFSESQVRAAVSQAMFFSSTQALSDYGQQSA